MAESNKLNFTFASLKAKQAPASGRVYYYDMKMPGLALCITAKDQRTYYLCKRVNGRFERVLLGRWEVLSVDQARERAQELSAQIAQGIDPQERKRSIRSETTFGALFEEYMIGYASEKRDEGAEDRRQYECHLKHWANKRLSSIHKGDVAALHNQVRKERVEEVKIRGKSRKRKMGGPYTANRLLALLSKVFNYAIAKHGFKGENPTKGIDRFEEESRERFLWPDELRKFWGTLLAEPDPLWRDFFTVALLTGARRSNVQAMKWADLQLDQGLWRISGSESKNREPMLVILIDEVLAVLRERKKAMEQSGKLPDYVFPSFGATGHITEPKKAWHQLLTRAGIKNLRIHDLRRTLGSYQAMSGASLPIIGQSLGHKSLQATQVYARLNVDPVRESVKTATAKILDGVILPLLPAPVSSDKQQTETN